MRGESRDCKSRGVRTWVFVTALGTMVVASGHAAAFCRTMTSSIPAAYDPVVSGCWTQGSPLAWLWDERVPYKLDAAASRQIGLADATRAADQAFAMWSSVQCAGGRPNVTAYDDGPVDAAAVAAECGAAPCDPTRPGTYHLIVFRDDGWAYDDPTNTLAMTTVTYRADSGIVLDAEIEINSHDHTLTTSQPTPPGAFDLRTILTHEAGHFPRPRTRDREQHRDERVLRAGIDDAHDGRHRGPLRCIPTSAGRGERHGQRVMSAGSVEVGERRVLCDWRVPAGARLGAALAMNRPSVARPSLHNRAWQDGAVPPSVPVHPAEHLEDATPHPDRVTGIDALWKGCPHIVQGMPETRRCTHDHGRRRSAIAEATLPARNGAWQGSP